MEMAGNVDLFKRKQLSLFTVNHVYRLYYVFYHESDAFIIAMTMLIAEIPSQMRLLLT